MKKHFSIAATLRISVLLFFAVNISGCTLSSMLRQSRKQQVSVHPQQLEVTGDSILLEVKCQIPTKLLRQKAVYAVELVYRYGSDQEETVGRLAFKPGEFVYEDNQPTITRQFSLPYTPAKNPGKLLLQGVAQLDNGRQKRASWQEIASGLVTTSTLIVHSNQVTYATDTTTQTAANVNTFTFLFAKGQNQLNRATTANQPELQDFLQTTPNITAITIIAGTSPEPAETEQPTLALQRGQHIRRYLEDKLNEINQFSKAASISLQQLTLSQTKEIVIKKIQNSALSGSDIQKIISVIYLANDEASLYQDLAKLAPADYLEKYIYPGLRSAELKISFNQNIKKDYEIYLLSKSIVEHNADPKALTAAEMRYAAALTPLLAEKQKIYETALATSGNWQTYHDLGIVYLQQAQKENKPALKMALLKAAIKNLTFASHRQPTAENFYHLATAQQQVNDNQAALQSYDYALKAGGKIELLQAIFADKAALHLKMGQLDEALAGLKYGGNSYQNYMNKGLCYLLKENYEQATTFYGEALLLKPNDALAYYTLAIIAARTKDENKMGANLHRAVQADKKFIAKAIDDLEFIPYRKQAVFRSALKLANR